MIFFLQARNSHQMDRVAPIAPSPSIINHAMPTQPPLVALVRGTLSPSTPNLMYSCQVDDHYFSKSFVSWGWHLPPVEPSSSSSSPLTHLLYSNHLKIPKYIEKIYKG
ncbi:hypothetical protein NC652_028542 [Populus alba x Populus x berolinensis]|nr:hypothetical protein NC652_028542 [Populus alba x Populus x berolinensis]